jgi:hypothetical protein
MYLGQTLSVNTNTKTFFTLGDINVNHEATINSSNGDIFTKGKIVMQNQTKDSDANDTVVTKGYLDSKLSGLGGGNSALDSFLNRK